MLKVCVESESEKKKSRISVVAIKGERKKEKIQKIVDVPVTTFIVTVGWLYHCIVHNSVITLARATAK